MSSKPAIEIKGLSKHYRISHQQKTHYRSLRDDITALLTKPFSLITGQTQKYEEFWALRDVSFEVNPGEVVGIIGRNGSGKSTLLKILSRITEPTTGEARMYGKVASLLEVGTGFHPELTGRENIYFNGSILGMSKKEIDRKFDDIVNFAETEKFLDTPVKFYSSGMYVRLAFAIAAHLEPEILIVDEVLAVGDAAFQKKCLGKMSSVASEGRTVLFVSHNMRTIEQLCDRGILLEHGQVKASGALNKVISAYSGSFAEEVGQDWVNTSGRFSDANFTPLDFHFEIDGKKVTGPFGRNQSVDLVIVGEVNEPDQELKVGYNLLTEDNQSLVMTMHTDGVEEKWPVISKGQWTFRTTLPNNILADGNYLIELYSGVHGKKTITGHGIPAPTLQLQILESQTLNRHFDPNSKGLLAPKTDWRVDKN